jgi:hypothetical protein
LPRRQHQPDWDQPIPVDEGDSGPAATSKPPLELWIDAPPAPPPEDSSSTEEEDDNPYGMADPEERRCSECRNVIEQDAVVCVHCGFHFEKREKIRREYEPLDRAWESGLPLRWRVRIFAGMTAASLASNILLVVMTDLGLDFGWGIPWLCATAMLAFLLGTYNRIHMTRNKRGRVTLKETWRICFVPLQEHELDLRIYEGVSIQQRFERTFWDWLMLLFLAAPAVSLVPAVLARNWMGILYLIPFAVVPALLWWLLVMQRTLYEASLTRDHGYAAKLLYRGWSKALQEEIVETLSVAARLHYDRGEPARI